MNQAIMCSNLIAVLMFQNMIFFSHKNQVTINYKTRDELVLVLIK